MSKLVPAIKRLRPSARRWSGDHFQPGTKSLETLSLQVLGAGLMFLMHTALAKRLGSVQYGVFSFAIATSAIVSVVVPLGWPTVLMRYVAQYRHARDWSSLRGVLIRSHQMTIVSSIGGALIVWALSRASWFSRDTQTGLGWAAMLLPFTSYMAVRRKAFQGFELFKSSIVPEDVAMPLLVVSGALFFAPIHASKALSIYIGASLIVTLVSIVWLVACLPTEVRTAGPIYRTREWMSVAIPTLLGLSAQSLMNRSDVMLLGVLSDMNSVGIYGATSRIASLNTFVLGGISTVVAPMLARAYHAGDIRRFRLLMRRSMQWSAAGALPMFVVMMLWPVTLLSLFGNDFARGDTLLRVLAIGQMINAATGPVGFALLMTGRERAFAVVMSIGAVVLVAAQALVIPRWGATGAAIATTACVAAVNITFLVVVSYRVREQSPLHSRDGVSPRPS